MNERNVLHYRPGSQAVAMCPPAGHFEACDEDRCYALAGEDECFIT